MKPNLSFFLELGGSFEEWNEVGFFSREIALYNQLAKNFFGTIYIFTYGSSTDLEYSAYLEKNIVVIPRGKRSKSYFNNFFYEISLPFQHRNILKRCDIFKTNQNSGGIAASIAKMLFPSKKLVIRSGYIGSELGKETLPLLVKLYYFFAENISYRLCDHVFIPTEDSHNLSKKYPFTKGKITKLNNFIDTAIFQKKSGNEKNKKFDIIYIARFTTIKNHTLLLNSIKKRNIRGLFVGRGETENFIKNLGKKLGLKLTFLNSVPNNELPQYYNSAKICAFPSLHEGCPKSLLEAMSCEVPAVALDSPGISNIIQNEKNGLIGPESSFKNNLFRLLDDPALRDTLGKNARKTILDEYSFSIIFEKEVRTYRDILNKKRETYKDLPNKQSEV